MKKIEIDTHRMVNSIQSLKEELERLTRRGELVAAIPEINALNPEVYVTRARADMNWGDAWCVTFQFDRCYARIFDCCRILFVHVDDEYGNGYKEELVTAYEDEDFVKEFKNHAEFLK